MAAALDDHLEDLWSDYRRSLARRGRSPQTEGVYRKSWEHFWRWAEAEGLPPDPAQIDYRVVNRWSDSLATTPASRNGATLTTIDPDTGEAVPKMLEPSTRRLLYRNVRPFFAWYAREFETPNPFHRADPPGDERARPVPVVPASDLRLLLRATAGRTFRDRRDHAVIRVLLDTGARLGELVSMKVDDWDRRADLLTLTGKTGTRITPVSLSTGEALARYLRERKTHRLADRPAMWLAARGALGSSGVAQLLKARCAEAGIPPINPHRFRHNWAHEFRVAGGSEGDLLYLAGWSSPQMAHRYGSSAAAERAQQSGRALSLGDRL